MGKLDTTARRSQSESPVTVDGVSQEFLNALTGGGRALVRGRRLTSTETANLRLFFGPALNTSKIRVHRHRFGGDSALCLDNHIFLPTHYYRADLGIANPRAPGSSSGDDKTLLALLVHEACHAWQYQKKVGRYRWFKALLEHIKYGRLVYQYDIEEKDCLADYRFEQQGSIVQDYALDYLFAGGHPRGARADRFRTVIRCSLPMPEGESGSVNRRRMRRSRPPRLDLY